MVNLAFVQYELGGQVFTTETVEQNTHNPTVDYSFVHHIDRMTPEVPNRLGDADDDAADDYVWLCSLFRELTTTPFFGGGEGTQYAY